MAQRSAKPAPPTGYAQGLLAGREEGFKKGYSAGKAEVGQLVLNQLQAMYTGEGDRNDFRGEPLPDRDSPEGQAILKVTGEIAALLRALG